VVEVLLWWLAFAGSHLILSSSWLRPRLIDPLTLWGYRALYSLVALATFLPLCFSYATVKGSGTLLFPALGHLPTCALMFVSVFFLLGSLVNPSPAGMVNTSLQAYGITKMTRHPFSSVPFCSVCSTCSPIQIRPIWYFWWFCCLHDHRHASYGEAFYRRKRRSLSAFLPGDVHPSFSEVAFYRSQGDSSFDVGGDSNWLCSPGYFP